MNQSEFGLGYASVSKGIRKFTIVHIISGTAWPLVYLSAIVLIYASLSQFAKG
jgi:hypothetical protein